MKFLAVFVAIVAVAAGFPTWNLQQLSNALQNPNTDPALVPYIEDTLNIMMEQLFAGNQIVALPVVTPAGFVVPTPALVGPVAPVSPVIVGPVAPVIPDPWPVIAEPVVVPAASSPLVQVIININAGQEAPVIPETVIDPIDAIHPVIVVDEAENIIHPIDAIDPVIVVDEAENIIAPVFPVIVPEPIIVPEPVILPEPIIPQPIIPEPIIVGPELVIVNPIDIIAVGEPEINPVDLINPIPVVLPSPALDGIIV